MNNPSLKNRKSKRGFTIVELLVAMSIFVVLVTIATGAFIQALRSEKRLLALMGVSNNASLVLEQMAREIRTGYLFSNSLVCGTPLSFKNSASGNISYNLSSVGGKGVIQRNGEELTASNVDVSNLCFLVSQGPSVCNPWRVTIMATVDAFPASPTIKPVTLQTTASSRILPRDMLRADKDGTAFKFCE